MEPRYLKKSTSAESKSAGLKRDDNHIGTFAGSLLSAANSFHQYHLAITGTGSYAAHVALGDLYSGLRDFADSLVEQYQGVSEKIVKLEIGDNQKISSTDSAISLLRSLYELCNLTQEYCGHSEIVNTIDEVKSLINTAKYKLLFLK